MARFKVGDRVILVKLIDGDFEESPEYIGKECQINDISKDKDFNITVTLFDGEQMTVDKREIVPVTKVSKVMYGKKDKNNTN
jgi:hypothetical protein